MATVSRWAGLMLVASALSGGSARALEVDVPQLLAETRKDGSDPGHPTVAWWIPEEYWSVPLGKQGLLLEADELLSTLRKYVLIGVVEGRLDPTALSVRFRAPEDLRGVVALVDERGRRYAPLPDDAIPPELRRISGFLRPMAANLLGAVGENLAFFWFPGTTDGGGRIAATSREGRFSVEVGDQVFTWRTPLSSVLPKKVCPVDGEEMSGAWAYCPWHGEELRDVPPAVGEDDTVDGTGGGAEGGFAGASTDPMRIACPDGGEAPVSANTNEFLVDRPPRPVRLTPPEYPAEAFAEKIEGTVTVEIMIGSDGRVLSARVIESVPGLDRAALETACRWTFEPAVKNGTPVPTIAHAPVSFRLQ